jgi:hypothetical protein
VEGTLFGCLFYFWWINIIVAKILKLKDVFALNEAGAAHGYDSQRHSMSYLPNVTPQSGQVGSPSTSASSSYSRFAQNTSTEEDIEDWMGDPDDCEDVGATFDPPYDVNRWRFYMDYGHPDNQVYGEGKMIREYIRNFLLELRKGEPMGEIVPTSAGDFEPRGRTGRYLMFRHASSGTLVGVTKSGDGFGAYNFEDHFEVSAATLEDALARSITSDELGEMELDEISAVGGAAMGNPGQASGQIRGHIGQLGADNRSPHLEKDKKKKKKESSAIRAFGGGKVE